MSITPPNRDLAASAVVLHAAEPVEEVQEDEITQMLPAVDHGRKLEIGSQAREHVSMIAKLNPNSPDYTKHIHDLNTIGAKEIEDTTAGPNRLLERAASSFAGSKKSGGEPTQKIASTLSELRSTVDDLTPNPEDLSPARKILGFIPGGNKIRKYFQKYESAQTNLDNIIKSLLSGKDELMRDNASLEQEKVKLWDNMAALNEYGVFAEQLDREVVAKISELKSSGQTVAANAMEADVLFAIRQRHQDILTQLGVSLQGYLAMTQIQRNNVELVKGVDRARTTTITALKTAMIVAQALDTEKLVLDQIDAVNAATNKAITATATMLKQNTARVQEQAVNSGVSVAALTQAFDDIRQTMDSVDSFRREANDKMQLTVDGLKNQLDKARPQLERSLALDSASGNNRAQDAITS